MKVLLMMCVALLLMQCRNVSSNSETVSMTPYTFYVHNRQLKSIKVEITTSPEFGSQIKTIDSILPDSNALVFICATTKQNQQPSNFLSYIRIFEIYPDSLAEIHALSPIVDLNWITNHEQGADVDTISYLLHTDWVVLSPILPQTP